MNNSSIKCVTKLEDISGLVVRFMCVSDSWEVREVPERVFDNNGKKVTSAAHLVYSLGIRVDNTLCQLLCKTELGKPYPFEVVFGKSYIVPFRGLRNDTYGKLQVIYC